MQAGPHGFPTYQAPAPASGQRRSDGHSLPHGQLVYIVPGVLFAVAVDGNTVPDLILDDEHPQFFQLFAQLFDIETDNSVIQFHIRLMLMAMFEQPTLKDTIQVLTEVQPLVAEDAEMAALVQQTIPKMQQLNEQQFKGLELEWHRPEDDAGK